MGTELSRSINDAVIRRLAGAPSYQRGLDYFSHGHVESLEDRDGSVYAVVRGNQDYTVTLAADDGVIDYSCDCPVGSDGAFCKHCVAAALAWLNRAAKPPSTGRAKTKEVTLADAGKILQAEDKDTLVRMVLDWAKDDDRLHERLILYAARRSGPETGAAAVRRAFESAVRVQDFVPYREATRWARGVHAAIDSIEQLLSDGQAAAVIELCESALQSLLGAMQAVDDSDGHFGGLRDRLEDIHYRACEEARPDPVELARRLFQWELHSDFDVFYGAAAQYAKILGAKGMKVYRELAEAEWEKVPARTAKHERSEWGQHFRITHIMESLAQASGDIEQLVAVMSRDLSSAYGYLKIAEVYREARQHDNALLWAEKGLTGISGTHRRQAPRIRGGRVSPAAASRGCDEAHVGGILGAAVSGELQDVGTAREKGGHLAEVAGARAGRNPATHCKGQGKDARQTRPRWMQADDNHSILVEIFLMKAMWMRPGGKLAWEDARTLCGSDSRLPARKNIPKMPHPSI